MAGMDKGWKVMNSNVEEGAGGGGGEVSTWVQGRSSVTVEVYTVDQRDGSSCYVVQQEGQCTYHVTLRCVCKSLLP
jgi:hypothetical protein